MKIQLDTHIKQLKSYIKEVSEKVEHSVSNAKLAFNNLDEILAKEVINQDQDIDDFEVKIDEVCIQILALHQPIARDLRFLFSCFKINNDLERIGDLSCSIVKGIFAIKNHHDKQYYDKYFSSLLQQINEIFDLVGKMISQSTLSFLSQDKSLAEEVFQNDLNIDRGYDESKDKIVKFLQQGKIDIKVGLAFIDICRYLERMGDYTKNICEQTVYSKEGIMVKHKFIVEEK